MTPAQRWGRYLRFVIRKRGVIAADVARAVGAASASMSDWTTGKKFPQLDYVVALADVLDHEPLLSYAVRLRTRTCETCGQEFVDTTKHLIATCCSKACKKTLWRRLDRQSTASKYKLDRARLDLHREAVAAHCRSCEPLGVCQTPDCKLREVSPLPLVRIARATGVVTPASPRMQAYITRRFDAA